jgi:hypothetical protein
MRYLIVLVLAGCAPQAEWTRADSQPGDLKKDHAQCSEQHKSAVLAVGMARAAIDFEKCMNARGWQGKFKETDFPK